MKLFTRRKPISAKAALGIEADEVRALGEDAVGEALGVIDAPPAPPATVIPSEPDGHLKFARRAVESMDEEEARILEWIADRNASHAAALAALESELAGVRKTRAFYQAAPGFLADTAPPPPATRRLTKRGQPKDQTNE